MEPLGATKPAAAAGSRSAIKHLRWWIAGLLFFATFFNYLDRQALSVAAPTICKALKFTETDYAHIVMAFLIAYMIMQALTGWMVDRIGVRIGLAAAVVLWSLACMAHALAQGGRSFVLFRFFLGAAEAANFPAGIRAVGEWFPPSEQSGATGIFTAGGSLGAIPGKRESRRFAGDHILTMNDIDRQAVFEDAVASGGWGFDHHPPGGVHNKGNPSTHQYLRGPHNVPLRSLYSRTAGNLLLAGRNLSVTHYALSSTRVMLTCAQLGDAVGLARAQVYEIRVLGDR